MKKTSFLFSCFVGFSMALQGQPTFLTLTSQGQGSGNGTISKYDAATNTITAIHTFGSEGIYPVGNLCKVSGEKYYAMTNAGGTLGYGVIFSFDAANSNYTVVHNFDNGNGAEPSGSLIKASNGKLYGITTRGGTSNLGVLFSFDPVTSSYTVLKNFDPNGYYPTGSLLQASDGKLYGMTWYGGPSNAGVIYSFDITNSVFTVVKNFANTDGAEPRGSLIQALDGKLYGMTSYGGIDYRLNCFIDPITNIPTCIITPGDGVIFSFDITTSTYNVLYNFNIMNGANPYGSLLQASNGKLYGLANRKNGGYGVAFSFDLPTSNYLVLKNFDSYPDGAIPYGSLTQGSDGKLYGTLSEGGGSFRGYGVAFSLDASTGNFIKQDFMGPNGARPFADLVEIKNIQLNCVANTTADAAEGSCSTIVSNIDPIISPAGSVVTYTLTGATTENGTGTASGLQYNVGNTTVTYTSTDDPSKTCSFTVSVNPTSAFYRDADTDGYGNAAEKIYACTQPSGYVTDNTDCNDNDASVHIAITYYRDADNDGFGDASSSSSLCQLTPPSGYVTNNSDCDDTQKLYQDSDGDGYGSTVLIACGGVTNNTDCDDNNAAINAPVTYYRDADNDGYGNISNTTNVCSITPPAGYVVNSTDCDDSKATTNPGATEICNNGIDDNCNGQSDEGCPAGIPSISINDVSVYESNGVAILTVSLSNAATSDIMIGYSTLDGTATSGPRGKKGADYVAASGNILVPAGSLSATIRITINTDNVVESSENFSVKLSLNKANAKKATISDGTGVVTILDGSANRLSANNKDITGLNQQLTIRALPNPSATYFTLVTQGNINQPISLLVYDVSGRIIERKYNLPANYSISIGHSYKPGLYLVEIMQGNQKQTLKLVKGSQ
ncbi:MAG TPA: choice-of-anchor tandem repeat GloVer-containing protein [Chitinophagaceae bacterium]|nr:choice-of-anchor tandem repeat GloVer-containing protein [Chitinophagaceae bacterium]